LTKLKIGMLCELIDCMCIEPIGSSPCNRNPDY
jgi:hypothetical protein